MTTTGRTLSDANQPKEIVKMSAGPATPHNVAPLETPTFLGPDGAEVIATALNLLLADAFALYIKTKNFHWHMSGPHFRDYHLLLDEQADQIFAMTDPMAERVRKLGVLTLHSIGEMGRHQRIRDNDADYVAPPDMLTELRKDNQELASAMRHAHAISGKLGDVATASLLEVWIDETERRVWFLFEAGHDAMMMDAPGPAADTAPTLSSAHDIAEYTADMVRSLRALAVRQNLDKLNSLLAAAEDEARIAATQ
jgi:starvation-inducible DNA-binding protein